MATSGNVSSSTAGTGGQSYFQVNWSRTSTDVSSNKSTISWTLRLICGTNIWYTNAVRIDYVKINGTTVKSTQTYSNKGNGTSGWSEQLSNGTIDVAHEEDGTKSFTIEISGWFYGYGTVTGSQTFALDAIPRASTMVVPSTMTMGVSTGITINRASSSFTHTVSYKAGSGSYTTIVSKTNSTSVSWTPPISLINTFEGTSGTVTLRLITYNGSTQIGDPKTYTAVVEAPAKSTMSVPVFTAGTAGSMLIERKNSSYRHKITYSFGSVENAVAVSTTSELHVSWTPDLELLRQIPNATSGTGTLVLTTLYGSISIGTTSYSFTLKAGSSAKPTASLTVNPDNSNQNSTVQGWGYYIKGLSKIRYSVGFTGYLGSTVSAREFTGNGQTLTSASGTTDFLSKYGTLTVKARVKDSRGRWSSSVTQSITVYNYEQPTISSVSAYRSTSSGTASSSGTYLRLYCSASRGASINNRNSIIISYTVKQGNTTVASGTLTSGTATVLSGYSTTSNYSVTITVTDTVGSAITRIIGIPSEVVTFHLKEGGDGAAFGGYAIAEKAVDFTSWDVMGKVFGLGRAKATVPSEANLNAYVEAGVYSIATSTIASSLTNCPSSYAGTLRVWHSVGNTITSYYIQEYTNYRGVAWTRYTTDTGVTWSDWKKIITSEESAYEDGVVTYDTTNASGHNIDVRRYPLFRLCHVEGSCVVNGGLSANTLVTVATLPSGYRPNRTLALAVSFGSGVGRMHISSAGEIRFARTTAIASDSTVSVWFAGDFIY